MGERVGEFFSKKTMSGRTTPKIQPPITTSRNSRDDAHVQEQQQQQQRKLQGRRRQHPYQTNARRKEVSRKRFPDQVASAVGVAVIIFLFALITGRGAWTIRDGGAESSSDGSTGVDNLAGMQDHDWSEIAATNPEVQLPNQDREIPGEEPEVAIPAGTRSPYYGEIQRQRQRWLNGKAQQLRRQVGGGGGEKPVLGQSKSGDHVDPFDTNVALDTRGAATATAAAEQFHEATGMLKPDGPSTAISTPRPSGNIGGKQEKSQSGKGSTNDSEEHRYVPGDTWTTQQGQQPRATGETEQASSTKKEARGKGARGVGSASRMERLSQLVAALGGNPAPARTEVKQREEETEKAKSSRVLPSASASAGSGAAVAAVAGASSRPVAAQRNDDNRNARAEGGGSGRNARGVGHHHDHENEDDPSRPGRRGRPKNRRSVEEIVPPVSPEPHEGSKEEQKPEENGATAGVGGQEMGSTGVEGPDGGTVPQALEGGHATIEDRIARMEYGAELWGSTYVPAIEPGRRLELIEKWTSPGGSKATKKSNKAKDGSKKKILLVVSSFDRGQRLGRKFRDLDKMNYVLMIMDEMREACEVGFSPQVHFIAGWDPTDVADLIRDRLFCERTGAYVPYSHEEHPPEVGNNLSLKHRIYMKSRLNKHDVFIQVEDDMILTLNHILLYLEHSQKLEYRRGEIPDFSMMPGYIRVEPGRGMGAQGIGEEWFEWEVLLSRFKGMKITGAGTYMGLDASRVLRRGGNNQGMWMLTQEQLSHLARKCRFLRYSEANENGNPETHSGSMEIFQTCKIVKVFPATEFEGFLIHHRTNNKNGQRGESIPAVPISMLRVWAEQFIRDSGYMVSYQ